MRIQTMRKFDHGYRTIVAKFPKKPGSWAPQNDIQIDWYARIDTKREPGSGRLKTVRTADNVNNASMNWSAPIGQAGYHQVHETDCPEAAC